MWAWDAVAPGRSAAGTCADEQRAQRAAEAWMLANGADSARLEQVNLTLAAGTLLMSYERTGVARTACRHGNGHITWSDRPAQ